IGAILEDYARALERGEAPIMGDFLPGDTPQRVELLAMLIQVDQSFHFRRGQPAGLEDYLKLFPELTAHRQWMAELIAAECRLRGAAGGPLPLDELQSRFPDYRDEIASLATAPAQAPTTRGAA